jgi:hypothetical protein
MSAVATLASMISGFSLTILISLLPDSPGDVAERLVPFAVALLIAYRGSPKIGVNQTMRSPLVSFSLFYFIGGLLAIVALGHFFDEAVATFVGAAWLAVGFALALITIGAQKKAVSALAHFIYLLGFAWLALLLVAGIFVIWAGGIGVPELKWLVG